MAEEPRASWTVETAMAHVVALMAANDRRYEQRFAEQKSAVDAALDAASRAVEKAEIAANKRFEGVNEFRGALADQQANLIQRSEVQVMFNALTEKQQASEKKVDALLSERAGVVGGWGYAAAVLGFVIGVAGLIAMLLGGS